LSPTATRTPATSSTGRRRTYNTRGDEQLSARAGLARRESTNWSLSFRERHQKFIGAVLNEMNVALAASKSSATPYLAVPDARILVTSSFPDGSRGSPPFAWEATRCRERRGGFIGGSCRNETSGSRSTGVTTSRSRSTGRVDQSNSTLSTNRLGTFQLQFAG